MHGPPSPRRFRTDTRSISPVIGAVLLLALAVMLLTILQTTAIPQLNAQVEFQHNQEVQADVVGLKPAVDRTAGSGHGETATVDVGVDYPPRLLFFNPPPAGGTLRTTDTRTVRIENAAATGETGDYWDGTTRTVETRALEYVPDYNEYGSAPITVYEPWVVYNRIDGRTLPRTDADLVDGRRISLVALDGQYAESTTGTVGLSLSPTSAPTRTVTVRHDEEPIQVTVPTRLRRDTWETLLADELDRPGTPDDRYVTGIDCSRAPPEPCGELTLTLERGSYELRLGEVAVGSGASQEPAAYLTDVDGNATAVPETGRQRLVVEARDRYDNPVSGVPVSGSVTVGEGTVRPVEPITDRDGHAVFVYEAPDDVDLTTPTETTLAFGDGTPRRSVRFDVLVTDRGAAAPPPSSAAVAAVSGTVATANVEGSDRGREVTFDLRADRPVTVTGVAVTTRNELDGRPYVDRDTTVGGTTLPSTFEGQVSVAIRDIDASRTLLIDRFVEPTSPDADVVVTFDFADGSSLTLGIA